MVFVFDTNVLISSAMGDGTARRALEWARQRGQLVACSETLRELAITLEKPNLQKFLRKIDKVEFLSNFIKLAHTIEVTERIVACRDASDDMWLELAVTANAKVIISGDKALLELNPFRGIAILNPSDFLKTII